MPEIYLKGNQPPETRPHVDVDLQAAAIRFMLLSTHYRHPLNWTAEGFEAARKNIRRLLLAAKPTTRGPPVELIAAISDDLNTPKAIALMHEYRRAGRGEDLFASLEFMGFIPPPAGRAQEKNHG